MLKFLEKIRINKCLEYCDGRILDIGCGYNNLVKKYGNGVGVDVYPWQGVDIVCDTKNLPFNNEEFDRVFLIATLNHIPKQERSLVLKEAYRVLKPNGKVIVTMIDPIIGFIWHKIGGFFWDKDQKERGMKEGESYGMTGKEVKNLLVMSEFGDILEESFEFGLNRIYVAKVLK